MEKKSKSPQNNLAWMYNLQSSKVSQQQNYLLPASLLSIYNVILLAKNPQSLDLNAKKQSMIIQQLNWILHEKLPQNHILLHDVNNINWYQLAAELVHFCKTTWAHFRICIQGLLELSVFCSAVLSALNYHIHQRCCCSQAMVHTWKI